MVSSQHLRGRRALELAGDSLLGVVEGTIVRLCTCEGGDNQTYYLGARVCTNPLRVYVCESGRMGVRACILAGDPVLGKVEGTIVRLCARVREKVRALSALARAHVRVNCMRTCACVPFFA